MCHFVCARVCVHAVRCVLALMIFLDGPAVADIVMDGPYALYGPCIFHIPAA